MQRDLENHLISMSRIRVHSGTEVSCLRFRGSVRKPSEEMFARRLADAGSRAPYLVVDLSEMEYLCSSGLGILLEQAVLQERQGGWLRLVSPSPTVSMILRLSGAASSLAWFAQETEALDDLPSRAA
jgi:anti-anti-sigma factor